MKLFAALIAIFDHQNELGWEVILSACPSTFWSLYNGCWLTCAISLSRPNLIIASKLFRTSEIKKFSLGKISLLSFIVDYCCHGKTVGGCGFSTFED